MRPNLSGDKTPASRMGLRAGCQYPGGQAFASPVRESPGKGQPVADDQIAAIGLELHCLHRDCLPCGRHARAARSFVDGSLRLFRRPPSHQSPRDDPILRFVSGVVSPSGCSPRPSLAQEASRPNFVSVEARYIVECHRLDDAPTHRGMEPAHSIMSLAEVELCPNGGRVE